MFKELIEKRRSVRQFTDQKVAREDLEKIIDAVYYAPTARNADDIELMVITQEEKLRELAGFKDHAATALSQAQAAIVVLSDKELSPVCHRQDACIAATYVLLAAVDAGLGACWLNVNSSKSDDGQPATILLHKMLGLPDKYNIESVIALGHPAGEVKKKTPREHAGKVHWDKF